MDRNTVLLHEFSTKCALQMILVLSLLIATMPRLQAQEDSCDESLKPGTGKYGYSLRPSDNRCEGLYISQVSGRLQIVSLFRGKLNLHSEHKTIKLSAPGFKELSTSSIHVRAVAIPLNTYYRMDAVITESDPLIWSLDDVVKPIGLNPNQIGIFGWVENNADKVFVPVDVFPEGSTESKGGANLLSTLVVRSAVDIEKLAWRSSQEHSEKVSEWQPYKGDTIRAGQPVSLVLPGGPTAVLHLEVAAKPSNDTWRRLNLRVLRASE